MSKAMNQPMKKPMKGPMKRQMKRQMRRHIMDKRDCSIELAKPVMTKTREFYAFRGNIVLPNTFKQSENNSMKKNKIFRDFFEYLNENKKVYLKRQNKIYCLSSISQCDTIIHCQLSVEEKNALYNCEVENTRTNNFLINIFAEIESQKFLIEENDNFFEEYSICIKIIENIMNRYLKKQEALININGIVEEQKFLKNLGEYDKIKRLKFDFTVPNLFDARNNATDFLNSARENFGATNVSITISNDKEKLAINGNARRYSEMQ